MSSINLGIWNPKDIKNIKIEDIDLNTTVEDFRNLTKNRINKDLSSAELVFCGTTLKNNKTLSSYGVAAGSTIYIFEKLKETSNSKKEKPEKVTPSRTLSNLAGHRHTLQRFARRDMIEKLIDLTPGLLDDPGAVAIIQDPELVLHLLNNETAEDITTEHPVLVQAATNMLKIAEEEGNDPNQVQISTSTGYSYSLDALSDDDDDMDSNSDTNITQNHLTRNASFNAITAAQLAAAIANATNTQFNTNSAGVPTTSSGNIITNEMFSNAIQQAIAYGSGAGFAQSPPTQTEEESIEALTRRWQTQLQQMHEMGLVNDPVNIRALSATNGDVNAAIEFVLSMPGFSN